MRHNILITGGTGFAGRQLVKYLDERNHYLHCIIRNDKKSHTSFDGYPIDKIGFSLIAHPENSSIGTFKSIIEENNIDTIVHNAAIAREFSISKDEYYKVNVNWTRNLAQAYIDSDIEHNKFIYISSVGVYGTNPVICPADENTPYNPDGKYHNSKMMAEKMLNQLYTENNDNKNNHKFPLIILRPSIMYGIGDFGFVYKTFKLVSQNHFPMSTKNYKIHLLDLDNFAMAINTIINKDSYINDNHIYNISDRDSVDMEDLLKFIKNIMGGGYFKVPSIAYSFLLSILNKSPALTIKFKLISKDWCYNTKHIENDFDLSLNDTFSSLEKYDSWYREAIINSGINNNKVSDVTK